MERIICITGGTNGIGRGLVKAFAEKGWIVEFMDIDESGLGFAEELNGQGHKTRFHKVDVGDHAAVAAAFSKIGADHGKVDVMINNAGVSKFKSFWELEPEEWDRILSVNLGSVFHCSREAAKLMKEGGGSIINLSSTRAFMSERDTEAYSATKGGIYSLSHSLAITLSEFGIRVNSISPGWIATEDYESLRDIDHAQHPAGRVGKPEDIARACLFLSDPENDFITGENLVIDGGMSRKMIYEH
ncbi:oxidoreductase [Rossellomorea marisflavi]|uniref:SDR family NAD(P)-dependent oxidoreductase n=1 Tax=Rossellomorea marisflavi TaxID=189381 RepID=UPI0025C8BAD8|nr:SDR family oxidoreductase [Rossellomorea marisflavi]GLI86105.1 oxidoreductase [Rossellomorea marisflavi]